MKNHVVVLGVSDGITCGAAVARDGEIVAAVNEERLCRKKMAYGFPRSSIREVMRLASIDKKDIDAIAVDTVNNFFSDGVREFEGWLQQDRGLVRNSVFSAAGRLSFLAGVFPGIERMYYVARAPLFARRRRSIRRILHEEFGLLAPVEFIDHHLAHATSTYFTSGFHEATVVSMDGGGDGLSSRMFVVHDGMFREIGFTSAFNSLANYYAYVTHICGFKAQKHEGKITGLAAHGSPIYLDLLNSLIAFRDGEIRNIGGHVFRGAISQIQSRLPKRWTKEDLAASIQKHCEDLTVSYIRHHMSAECPSDVAVAGGLFANVRINQRVYEIDRVRRLWVHPGMTDCGLAVGAALAPTISTRSQQPSRSSPNVIRHVYIGPGFSSEEIERELTRGGLAFEKPASIESRVARLLADGHVVARFSGKMEYGPRALGNRSILYQPADPSVNTWLNERLHRTEFMPFAPSTLIEHAGQHYHNWRGALDAARFMTITFDCTPWMKKNCPGVVHIDGTARPQLVVREDNPSFYRVIDKFRQLTGVATIINTSFNMHEEPIVCSPQDAIRAFRLGHLDYLAIGDFLVPSPEPINRPLRPMHNVVGDECSSVFMSPS